MTSPTYRIRPGQPSDLAPLLALERSIPTAPHWSESDYKQCFDAPEDSRVKRRLFVAESSSSSALHGFAVAKLVLIPNLIPKIDNPEAEANSLADAASEAEIESIAVAPSARRLGIASRLCAAVRDWLADAGATSIELEVRSGSVAAIALYRQLGFTPYATRPSYYRDPIEDALLMRLLLTAPPIGSLRQSDHKS